jgi:chromate transport protein ChrA
MAQMIRKQEQMELLTQAVAVAVVVLVFQAALSLAAQVLSS